MSPSRQASVGLRVASVVFAFVGLAHAVALWFGMVLQIGDTRVGPAPRIVVILVTAVLSFWLWQLAAALEKPASPPGPPVA